MGIDATTGKTGPVTSGGNAPAVDTGTTTGQTANAGNAVQFDALAQTLIEQGQQLATVLSQSGGLLMGQTPQAQGAAVGIPAPADELLALLRDGGSDNMAMLMTALNTKTMQNQLDSAVNDIKANQGRQSQLNADRLQKIQESIQKERDAQPGFWGKFFGWVGKIASLIASVATIVAGAAMTATGIGAAAGIALMAVGVMGTVSTLGSIVNEFLPADKKLAFPLSIGGLIGFIAQKSGMDPEKAQALAGWIDIGITIITAVVMLVPQAIKAIGSLMKNIGSKLANLAKATTKATESAAKAATTAASTTTAATTTSAATSASRTSTELSNAVKNSLDGMIKSQAATAGANNALGTSRMISGVSGMGSGASAMGTGFIALENADVMKQSRDLQAQAKDILARLTRLQTQSEQLTEAVNLIVDAMQTAWTEGSKIINQTLQNAGDIANNAAAPVRA